VPNNAPEKTDQDQLTACASSGQLKLCCNQCIRLSVCLTATMMYWG